MISDRDPKFASRLYQELGKLLGIKLAMSTAYHPQTDGETERVNQELEVYLRVFCSNNPETWKQFLATAEFAHNQKFHSAVKNTPFYLMMGSHPRAIPLAYPKTDVPAAEQRIAQLQHARDEASAAHELARQVMAVRGQPLGRIPSPFLCLYQSWTHSYIPFHYITLALLLFGYSLISGSWSSDPPLVHYY